MRQIDKIIAAHLRVTSAVSHFRRMKSDRYFVWQEERAQDLIADGVHAERVLVGTTDLFTKREFDQWAQEFEKSLELSGIAWYLNSVQYEDETGFYHYEWVWEVT